eukprot:GHVT01080346.1.p3 GENE.GHVT01080346.1~~GHVT01080346.1.p3  ORF type:complete len:103 (-),score=10.90 GHVT01080346.1:344-652(-)
MRKKAKQQKIFGWLRWCHRKFVGRHAGVGSGRHHLLAFRVPRGAENMQSVMRKMALRNALIGASTVLNGRLEVPHAFKQEIFPSNLWFSVEQEIEGCRFLCW